MRKLRTRVKKVASVSFLFFHEPLAKHVRISHGFWDFNFEGFFVDGDEGHFFTILIKNHHFHFFTRVSGFRSKWTSKFHKFSLKNNFPSLFHETLLKSLRD